MVPMNLTRYMLEYTLEVICHGNRSECARRMGMEYLEFKKLRNRIMAGGRGGEWMAPYGLRAQLDFKV